jgi:hypothetical protein
VTRERAGQAATAAATVLAPGRVRIAIVVDTSASASVGADGAHPGEVVARAIARLKAAGDVVSLVTFDDRVEIRVPPTGDAGALDAAASAIQFEVRPDTQYRSTVWDAALAAAALTAGGDEPVLMLLVSDGRDNASWNRREEATRALAHSGVVVDLVSVPKVRASYDGQAAGTPWPEKVTSGTGGERYDSTEVDRLARRLDTLRQRVLSR